MPGAERRIGTRREPGVVVLVCALLAGMLAGHAAAASPLQGLYLGTGGDGLSTAAEPRLQTGVQFGLPAAGRASILAGGIGGDRWDLEGDLRTADAAARFFGMRPELDLNLTNLPLAGRARMSGLRVTPTLHRSVGALELETGATWATGTTGSGWSSGAGLVWGIQHARGPIRLSWEGRTGAGTRSWSETGGPRFPGDTSYVIDPYTIAHRSRRTYGDTQLRLQLDRHRWQAGVEYGVRVGRDSFGPRSFGGLETAWSLRPGIALFASSHLEPSVPEQRLPARRVARAGLSLTRLPFGLDSVRPTGAPRRSSSEFRLRPTDDGRLEIACRVPNATRLRASGDFSDWQPREMEPAGGGWWRLRAAIAPGPHQISVAIDGGDWIAPPGLPARDDGFGGSVGLFVLP